MIFVGLCIFLELPVKGLPIFNWAICLLLSCKCSSCFLGSIPSHVGIGDTVTQCVVCLFMLFLVFMDALHCVILREFRVMVYLVLT